jgi:hypothetical protein
VIRTAEWHDPVAKAVTIALARVVDGGGPSTVAAARELRVELAKMGIGEVSIVDQLQKMRAERRAGRLGAGNPPAPGPLA